MKEKYLYFLTFKTFKKFCEEIQWRIYLGGANGENFSLPFISWLLLKICIGLYEARPSNLRMPAKTHMAMLPPETNFFFSLRSSFSTFQFKPIFFSTNNGYIFMFMWGIKITSKKNEKFKSFGWQACKERESKVFISLLLGFSI